jgi:group I intron endonuclease
MTQNKPGIYIITNLVNKKMYFGKSIDIQKRIWRHHFDLEHGTHHSKYLQRSWDKYGEENFEFKAILYCEECLLEEYEKKLISLYDSFYNGYNMTSGGEKGFVFSEESRKKQVEKLGEYHKNRLKHPGKCIICGTSTKNGYTKYCTDHQGWCRDCLQKTLFNCKEKLCPFYIGNIDKYYR